MHGVGQPRRRARRMVVLAQALAAAVVASGVTSAAAPEATAQAEPEPPEVTVTELPSLPGQTGTGWIYDLNNRGQVAGESGREPVLWEEGRPRPLWIGPDSGLRAEHINDRGEIVLEGLVVNLLSYAFFAVDGQVSVINPAGDYDVDVLDLNEGGQVLLRRTPTFQDAINDVSVVELWQDGAATDLRLPAPPQGLDLSLAALSDGGHVVFGYGQTAAFGDAPIWRGTGGVLIWQAGTVTRLTSAEARAVAVNRSGQVVAVTGNPMPFVGDLDGALYSGGRTVRLGFIPADINDRGQVVGQRTVDGRQHAVLWEDGRLTDLGTLGGDSSRAIAVNERGQVLGVSRSADGTDHAFLWTSGRMVDLGRVGSSLGQAYDLNDEGQAIGPMWTPSVAPPITSDAKPVMWTVHDDGGPVEPPPGPQCATATNQAHVQAGRATSWLVFTWAAGSGTYLGLASQTTSLSEAAAGRWEPVAAC
jgi:probable HAF family extracellular repeat protein